MEGDGDQARRRPGQVETVIEMVETAMEEAETGKRIESGNGDTLLSGVETVMKGVEMETVMEMMVQCGMC